MERINKKNPVVVHIESIKTSPDPFQTVLMLKVVNKSDTPIWLVNDEWFVWKKSDSQINLSFAREKMQSGVQVFAYFIPKMVKLEPKNSFQRIVKLKWPLVLSGIWNQEEEVDLSPGRYNMSVTMGYGLNDMIENNDVMDNKHSVEEKVFKWQKYTTSNYVDFRIPT